MAMNSTATPAVIDTHVLALIDMLSTAGTIVRYAPFAHGEFVSPSQEPAYAMILGRPQQWGNEFWLAAVQLVAQQPDINGRLTFLLDFAAGDPTSAAVEFDIPHTAISHLSTAGEPMMELLDDGMQQYGLLSTGGMAVGSLVASLMFDRSTDEVDELRQGAENLIANTPSRQRRRAKAATLEKVAGARYDLRSKGKDKLDTGSPGTSIGTPEKPSIAHGSSSFSGGPPDWQQQMTEMQKMMAQLASSVANIAGTQPSIPVQPPAFTDQVQAAELERAELQRRSAGAHQLNVGGHRSGVRSEAANLVGVGNPFTDRAVGQAAKDQIAANPELSANFEAAVSGINMRGETGTYFTCGDASRPCLRATLTTRGQLCQPHNRPYVISLASTVSNGSCMSCRRPGTVFSPCVFCTGIVQGAMGSCPKCMTPASIGSYCSVDGLAIPVGSDPAPAPGTQANGATTGVRSGTEGREYTAPPFSNYAPSPHQWQPPTHTQNPLNPSDQTDGGVTIETESIPPMYRHDPAGLGSGASRPVAKTIAEVRMQMMVHEGFSRSYALAVMKKHARNPHSRVSITHFSDGAVAHAISSVRNRTGHELEFTTDISNPGSYKLAETDKGLQIVPHQPKDLAGLLKALLVAKPILVQSRALSSDWMFEFQKFDFFTFGITRDYEALKALNPRASELAIITKLVQMIDAFLAHQQDIRCDFTDRQCAGPIYDQLRDAIADRGPPKPIIPGPPTPPGTVLKTQTLTIPVKFSATSDLCKKDAVGLKKCTFKNCRFKHVPGGLCAQCNGGHKLKDCPQLEQWNLAAMA